MVIVTRMHHSTLLSVETTAFWVVLCCVVPTWTMRIPQPNATFQWAASQWGTCIHKDPGSCCNCHHVRNVTCVYKTTGEEVAPFYCRKLIGPRPSMKEPCPRCQQDCVLSTWGKWSSCSQTCSPGYPVQDRQILLLPSENGMECGPLIEFEECERFLSCEAVDPRPKYSWLLGNWTGCRKVRKTDNFFFFF